MRIGNDIKGEMDGSVVLTPEDIKMIAYSLSWCEGDEMIVCEDHLISFGTLSEQFRMLDVHFSEKELDNPA